MRRSLAVVAAVVAFLLGGVLLATVTPVAHAAKPAKAPEIIEEPDGDLLHVFRKDDPAAQGWLYRPKSIETPDAASPVDLIVVLHGHGGTPKTLFLPQVMEARRAWCLGVAGHAELHEKDEAGKPVDGFQWDGANVSYILDLTRHLIAKYPIKKERVLVWGHSAGGSMTVATLAEAPEVFAGGLTTASPTTPDGRLKEKRVAVLLGTNDPNWSGASAVRNYVESFEKKKAKGACAFVAVEGLGHALPDESYIALGFDWVLHGAARGGEAKVPMKPAAVSGTWRHILVRTKGAEGAGPEVKTTKKAAGDLLKKTKKDLDAGHALFAFEALCHSDHRETASGGGAIDEEALKALVGTLPEVEPGKTSEVIESPRGMHLLYREPPASKE